MRTCLNEPFNLIENLIGQHSSVETKGMFFMFLVYKADLERWQWKPNSYLQSYLILIILLSWAEKGNIFPAVFSLSFLLIYKIN